VSRWGLGPGRCIGRTADDQDRPGWPAPSDGAHPPWGSITVAAYPASRKPLRRIAQNRPPEPGLVGV